MTIQYCSSSLEQMLEKLQPKGEWACYMQGSGMSSTPNQSPEKADAAGSAVVGLELTLKVQRVCRSAASSAIIPGTIA